MTRLRTLLLRVTKQSYDPQEVEEVLGRLKAVTVGNTADDPDDPSKPNVDLLYVPDYVNPHDIVAYLRKHGYAAKVVGDLDAGDANPFSELFALAFALAKYLVHKLFRALHHWRSSQL